MLVMDQIQILIKSLCDRKKLLQKLKSDTSEKKCFFMKPVQMCGCWNERYRRQKKKMQRCMKNYVCGIVEKEDFDNDEWNGIFRTYRN